MKNRFYHTARIALLSVVSVCVCLAPGCGEHDGTSIHGTVTLDGAPVEGGSINFFPTKGTEGPVVGAAISDGEYKISAPKGPPIGTHQIEIRSSGKTGRKVPAGSPHPPGTMFDEVAEMIPAQYNSNSTLEREVKAGKNTLHFDLKSSGSDE